MFHGKEIFHLIKIEGFVEFSQSSTNVCSVDSASLKTSGISDCLGVSLGPTREGFTPSGPRGHGQSRYSSLDTRVLTGRSTDNMDDSGFRVGPGRLER